jgi:tRNA 2-thiouridine synthesizing protein A
MHYLDVKNMLCPIPVIRLSEMVNKLNTGDIIHMAATDKGVLQDIPAWCKVHGNKVVKIEENKSDINIIVEIK